MKISYRTHPIIEKMELNSLGIMPIDEDDKPFFDLNNKFFVYWWKHYLPHFKQSIIKISDSFTDASLQASSKLIDLYGDITTNDLSDFIVSESYIYRNIVLMVYQSFKKGSEDIDTAVYGFTKEGTPLFFFIDNNTVFQTMWASQSLNLKTAEEVKTFVYGKVMHGVIIYMFKKYAVVETKFLPAGKKVKDVLCNYKNDTKTNITYLDSTWFTTLIKSEGFDVRGHLRLQPCGEGMKDRKLIWINPFRKEGYTAPARKLKEAV